ncbi:MAG: ComF family protein [Jatrophihabitantaceae bacterium]
MSLLAALADLVLPRSCVGCARPGQLLCSACRPRIAPFDAGAAGVPVRAAAVYDGAVRTALLAYKERGRRDLAGPLGGLLARAIPAGGQLALVPVPSTLAAARARGGDHVLRLTRVASQVSGHTVVPALALTRAVRDSAGLHTGERRLNLDAAMGAAVPRAGLAALVVEDIVTTGSTLREARRALRAAGWTVHGAAVVAATARRDRSPRARSGPARGGGLAWG